MGLWTERGAVEFTSSLEKIDPSGKIQAIFTNLGAALMWKTAISKGITREDMQPAFHELNNQTREIMNHERPAASLLPIGGVGMAIAINPILLLGSALLKISTLARQEQKKLSSLLRSLPSSARSSTVEALKFDSLDSLHSSPVWDSLTVLLAMETTIQSMDPKKFSYLVAGFPLSRLHATQAKITLRRFFTDEQHVRIENFVFSKLSKPFNMEEWYKDHPERAGVLIVVKKHLAILKHFASYFHYTDDPDVSYAHKNTQDEDRLHFEIFPKTLHESVSRRQAASTDPPPLNPFRSARTVPLSPFG
ncbi:hypothetical protein JCM5353_002755 [Sporobolomyces roseus]